MNRYIIGGLLLAATQNAHALDRTAVDPIVKDFIQEMKARHPVNGAKVVYDQFTGIGEDAKPDSGGPFEAEVYDFSFLDLDAMGDPNAPLDEFEGKLSQIVYVDRYPEGIGTEDSLSVTVTRGDFEGQLLGMHEVTIEDICLNGLRTNDENCPVKYQRDNKDRLPEATVDRIRLGTGLFGTAQVLAITDNETYNAVVTGANSGYRNALQAQIVDFIEADRREGVEAIVLHPEVEAFARQVKRWSQTKFNGRKLALGGPNSYSPVQGGSQRPQEDGSVIYRISEAAAHQKYSLRSIAYVDAGNIGDLDREDTLRITHSAPVVGGLYSITAFFEVEDVGLDGVITNEHGELCLSGVTYSQIGSATQSVEVEYPSITCPSGDTVALRLQREALVHVEPHHPALVANELIPQATHLYIGKVADRRWMEIREEWTTPTLE